MGSPIVFSLGNKMYGLVHHQIVCRPYCKRRGHHWGYVFDHLLPHAKFDVSLAEGDGREFKLCV